MFRVLLGVFRNYFWVHQAQYELKLLCFRSLLTLHSIQLLVKQHALSPLGNRLVSSPLAGFIGLFLKAICREALKKVILLPLRIQQIAFRQGATITQESFSLLTQLHKILTKGMLLHNIKSAENYIQSYIVPPVDDSYYPILISPISLHNA